MAKDLRNFTVVAKQEIETEFYEQAPDELTAAFRAGMEAEQSGEFEDADNDDITITVRPRPSDRDTGF